VFNLVENLEGGLEDVNAVPSVCRAMGWGYTGGSSESLILTQDKALTKYRLSQHGINVPLGVVVPIKGKIPEKLPEGTLFVKPLASDGSEGIDAEMALIETSQRGDRLAQSVKKIHDSCNQPALIEEFIDGRELNLSLMQRGDEIIPLPPSEVDFSLFESGRPHVVDYSVKWRPGTLSDCISPRRVAQLDDLLRQHLADIVKRSWVACGGGDYGRIDCRMDKNGVVYVLEVNVNCDISPLAGLPAALTAAGIPFTEFINQLLQNAVNRK
jgi:D-alanine-D-alanine ligase